jgi:PAS domain
MTRAVDTSATPKAVAAKSLAPVGPHLYSHIDHLTTPLWVFDIDRSRVVWANRTALEVWKAATLQELTARDLGPSRRVLRNDIPGEVTGGRKELIFETPGARWRRGRS